MRNPDENGILFLSKIPQNSSWHHPPIIYAMLGPNKDQVIDIKWALNLKKSPHSNIRKEEQT